MNLDEMLQKRMAAKKQASLDDMLKSRMETREQGGSLRPMGVGLRNVVEGATSFLDIPANFIAGVGNAAVLGADALTEAVTGEDSNIDQYARFTGIRPLVSDGLSAIGVPTAQNATEKMIGSGIEAGTAALTGYGAGKAIKEGIDITENAIRSALSDMPVRQLAGSLLGDASAQGATALSGNPIVGAVAGILGGAPAGFGARAPQNPFDFNKAAELRASDVGKLLNLASKGDKKAMEQVAQIASVNPQIIDDAKALGFDLPADMLSDSRMIKQAAGLTRSQVATQDSVLFDDSVAQYIERGDKILGDLGANSDISMVSQRVSDQMQSAVNDGVKRAGALYKAVDLSLKPDSPATMDSTFGTMRMMIKNLGGDVSFMNAPQKKLYSRLFDADGNPKKITYQALRNLKGEIQQAAYNRGDLAGIPAGEAKMIASALRDDQLATARNIGGVKVADKLKAANEITHKTEQLRQKATTLFGEEFEKSIATPIRTAVTQASKGDVGNLRKMLNALPKEMRKEVLLTAIMSSTRAKGGQAKGDFGMSEFSTFMKNLQNNKSVRREMAVELGGDTMKTLESLGRIAGVITEARANVIGTGKANQAMLSKMAPERFITAFVNHPAIKFPLQAVTIVPTQWGPNLADMAARGVAGTPQDDIKKVNALFNDAKFLNMVSDVASGRTPSIPRVASSPAFVSWANASGIKNPRAWLTNFVQQIQGVDDNG